MIGNFGFETFESLCDLHADGAETDDTNLASGRAAQAEKRCRVVTAPLARAGQAVARYNLTDGCKQKGNGEIGDGCGIRADRVRNLDPARSGGLHIHAFIARAEA